MVPPATEMLPVPFVFDVPASTLVPPVKPRIPGEVTVNDPVDDPVGDVEPVGELPPPRLSVPLVTWIEPALSTAQLIDVVPLRPLFFRMPLLPFTNVAEPGP